MTITERTSTEDGKAFHVGDPVRYVNWAGETYTVGKIEAILPGSHQLVVTLLNGNSPLVAPVDDFETLGCEPPTGFQRLHAHWGVR